MVKARIINDEDIIEVEEAIEEKNISARLINDESVVMEIEANSDVKKVNLQSTFNHNLLLNRDLPDQHPISAITGLAEALQRADTFVFEQAVASDTWTIEHNLGKKPSVTVVDSADNVFYPAVQYINENKLVVTMNGATTGKAYLN